MSRLRRFDWTLVAQAMVLGVALVVTGCGGETASTKPATDSQTTASPLPEKSKVKGMSPGGEMTARERRAARKKANSSSE